MEPFLPSAKEPSLFLLPRLSIEGVTAGFTGRAGGVSGEPWASFNMGLHVGDSDEHVVRNRERLTETLGWPFEAFTCAEQVHGNRVYCVTEKDRGRGRQSLDDAIAGCDGIMTDVPGVLLVSFYADCVPLYFYDPVRRAAALAHAGWRGTAGKIAEATARAMHEAYGSRPDQLLAAIGPSIGGCCYEVDGPVIGEMNRVMEELALPEAARRVCMKELENGKAALDLKEINRQIMIKAGILPSRIEMSTWCTGCRTDLFYSHRMESGRTGRMASWIGIAER